ncbi:hypothetical protein SAMN04488109_5331 [Chryseolinea serpens]|uniref:Uncharacterized protein n=1 Tax=Chryseolinea serpens TaxID=947013 RepID=A0A1M5VRY8_9BACT|nr:hypothetical protein SAMN04488109_5331 [Chryseolinea serpens]
MKYKTGDRVPNGEAMVRRIKREWIKENRTISREAFRPRKDRNGQFEDGVSVDIKSCLTEPIGHDYWSNKRKMATAEFLSDVINACPPYVILYDGRSPSHCIIAGDMVALDDDPDTLARIAASAILIHNPFTQNRRMSTFKFHSSFNDFVGFAKAALTACAPTVNPVTKRTKIPVPAKCHHVNSIL